MEKIFDVMGCEDAFKTRLAVYKFEGNALAWWKAYKQAKGGDAWLVTVTWADFKKLFFLQFFPRAEQEGLKREYHSIRQTSTETSTESTLNHLMCMSYTDVAQVANAARNYEILHERDDEDTERPDKRPGVPLRATLTYFALLVDVDTQESVIELLISHMEKIFDVMGCEDVFKTRLAVYKFEGNALAWWKAYKQAKGGDAWLVTMTWSDFKKLFFLQFFLRAEQERLKREYHSIRQTSTET
nr:hypothetical protein [Tanacetum cinerariifolium]